MINTASPAVEQTRQVRATYLLQRAMFMAHFKRDGQFDKPSPRVLREWDGLGHRRAGGQESLWHKIVRFANQHQVDPIHLVKAGFWDWTEFRAPLPQSLLRPELIEAARNYEATCREDLSYQVKSWADQAKMYFCLWRGTRQNVADEKIWLEVIISPQVSIGPLFRYVLASSLGMHDVAEDYIEKALPEYLADPDGYDAVMGDHIPSELREKGRQRLQEIYNQLGA
jgi:hypothetical protein